MARKVIWSPRAQRERREIFEFWNEHNGSKAYSRKLQMLIKEAVQVIKYHPEAGRRIDLDNVRVKLVRE